MEGASRTCSVGIHTHPGQTEVIKCETALSSPGEAGNWQNMNFTEGWTQNPWVTPSGWGPEWAHIWVLATGCVWGVSGARGAISQCFSISSLPRKRPPVAPRTTAGGEPCPWQGTGIVPCIPTLSTPLHHGDKAFANKETKGHHASRTALRWSSFFNTAGRWLWGPRAQGPGTECLRFQISQSRPERRDAPRWG